MVDHSDCTTVVLYWLNMTCNSTKVIGRKIPDGIRHLPETPHM